jgi:O-antigen ligase
MSKNCFQVLESQILQKNYKNNKGGLFVHIFIFALFLFYILSSAVNILLFHFVLDVNLAKVGMLFVIVGLGILVRHDFGLLWKNLKLPLIIIICWSLYLILNSYLGATPGISFKLTLRVFGAWIIALEIGLLLHQPGKQNRVPIVAALIFSLLIITLIWYLISIGSPSFSWFQQHLSNYRQHGTRLSGLYLSPNELGYALVMQAMVLIWYSLHPIGSLFLIPFAATLSFIGIFKSESRNSFLGMCFVVVVGLIVYLGQLTPQIGRKKTVLILLGFSAIFIIGIYYLPDILPTRVNSGVIALNHAIEKASFTTLDFKEMDRFVQSISQESGRRQIWIDAYGKWAARPWLGLGLGSYLHLQKLGHAYTTHNFIYGVLIEQGIIGISFLLLFFGCLVVLMKNWAATCLLILFPLTLLFDDLSPSYVFPVYSSLVLGFCFYTILQRPCQA